MTESETSSKDWVFRLLVSSAFLAGGYLVLRQGLFLQSALARYLPLILPLAVTLLSILARAGTIRDYEAVLKISSDLAIGIISFDVWALSVSRTDATGRVLVNAAEMIRGDFVLPLLIIGLLVAVGTVVLSNYPFASMKTKQRCLLGGLLFSILAYLAPFGALEPIPVPTPTVVARTAEVGDYLVVIPFLDPSVVAVAPTYLRDRRFVRIEKAVEATGTENAKALAIQRFLASAEADQAKDRKEKVAVEPADVIAVPTPKKNPAS